jgi:hypothetical protein
MARCVVTFAVVLIDGPTIADRSGFNCMQSRDDLVPFVR